MQVTFTIALFVSLSGVLATPIARDSSPTEVQRRAPGDVVIASEPGNSPLCDGKIWSPSDLIAAIQQAAQYKTDNQLQGKDGYPHVFENRPQKSSNVFKWLFDSGESFDFPNCPNGELLEFPLMRDTSRNAIYQGGANNRPGPNNPDRVIFTYQSPTAATYCGVISHKGTDDAELFNGDFVGCTPLF